MDANLLFVYDETKVVENGLEMRVTGGSPQSLFLDAESLPSMGVNPREVDLRVD